MSDIELMDSKHPKYVDLLDEDKPIAGQKFTCISFVSPENILAVKEQFFFTKFLKNWDLSKSLDKFTEFMNFVSYKYKIDASQLQDDLKDFVKDQIKELQLSDVKGDYDLFIEKYEDEIMAEFNKEHGFQTSVRGIKVRGTFETQEEAEMHCKKLRELDPNHDVYVGPVGLWMPWEPSAFKTGRVEHLNPTLNKLMHHKNENQRQAKEDFDKRVFDAKKNAIDKNIKLAQETGNKLTQNLNEDGNLVSMTANNKEISTADLKEELLKNVDRAPPAKESDHGLSLLQNSQNTVIKKN